MDTHTLRYVLWFVTLLGALGAVTPAHAWISRTWTVETIAKEAYAIAVGEVTGTSVGGGIPANQTGGPDPLLRMTAHVTVLRSYSDHAEARLHPGDVIAVTYRSLTTRGGMGPPYLSLQVGDLFAFPLKGPQADDQAPWELVDDISDYPLVPCARETLADGTTGEEFLLNELAGALASSDRELVLAVAQKAGRSLADHRDITVAQRLDQVLGRHLGVDEARWLGAAIALYCGMGTPRPSLAELLAGSDGGTARAAPAMCALSHLSREGLDERLIDALLRHANLNPWGAGIALKDNYLHDPAAISRLTKGLQTDEPGVLVLVAGYFLDERDHPLTPVAIEASLRVVRDRDPLPDPAAPPFALARRTISRACWVLRTRGDDRAFGVLLEELREARKTDPNRFGALWSGCHPQGLPRVAEFCRIAIDDSRVIPSSPSGYRFCESATAHLQRETGQDFGWSHEASLADRDAAVARAKAWLAKH